jgi:hypothetical protein
MVNDIAQLEAAIAALPLGFIPTSDRSQITPAFEALVRMVASEHGSALGGNSHGLDYLRWALVNAMHAAGVPAPRRAGLPQSIDVQAVAKTIHDAFFRKTSGLVYLCPLDLADDIPEVRFGPCRIQSLTVSELEAVFQASRLRSHFPTLVFDSKAYSQFSWLIVEDSVPTPPTVGERVMPVLYLDMSQDFSAIDPHYKAWPERVDLAVFALLLLPQEDFAYIGGGGWRNFRIPWVYTAKQDPFIAPSFPLGHETLTWRTDFYPDPHTGEDIEYERPERYQITDDEVVAAAYAKLDDARWNKLCAAIRAPLFRPQIVHFLVRAFSADGIDEFLAHITAIEAALGMKSDYARHNERPMTRLGNIGATKRIAERLAQLLNDDTAAAQFQDLFQVRSEFLHGRDMVAISSQKRIMARRLARRAAVAMVDAALADGSIARDDFLSVLCP